MFLSRPAWEIQPLNEHGSHPYAQQHGIPRATLGYWLRKDVPDHLDADLVWFFRCPAGYAFQRLLEAIRRSPLRR